VETGQRDELHLLILYTRGHRRGPSPGAPPSLMDPRQTPARRPALPLLDRARRSCVVRVVEPRGQLEICLPQANVCLSIIEGHLSAPMAQRWIEGVQRHVERGVVFDTFHDWERMSGYESGARQALTAWVVSNVRAFRTARFLVAHSLVRMGVSAASVAVALAGMQMSAVTERAAFEEMLAPHVR
jgi:hypothetical protein